MDKDQLAADFAVHMVEGMDWDTLFMFAVERLRSDYELLSEEELLAEVREYAPHLVDEDAE